MPYVVQDIHTYVRIVHIASNVTIAAVSPFEPNCQLVVTELTLLVAIVQQRYDTDM